MLNIKFSVLRSEETEKTLRTLKKRLSNYREYFETVVGPAIFEGFAEVFRKEGAVGQSRRWKPLAPATLAEKKARGLRLEILRRTDRLRKAYSHHTLDTEVKISKNQLVFRNKVPYGATHEVGTSRVPKRTVIARLVKYKEFHRKIEDGLSQYITEGLEV